MHEAFCGKRLPHRWLGSVGGEGSRYLLFSPRRGVAGGCFPIALDRQFFVVKQNETKSETSQPPRGLDHMHVSKVARHPLESAKGPPLHTETSVLTLFRRGRPPGMALPTRRW